MNFGGPLFNPYREFPILLIFNGEKTKAENKNLYTFDASLKSHTSG